MSSRLRSATCVYAALIFCSAAYVEAVKVGQTVEWVNDDKTMPHEVNTDPNVASNPSNVSVPEGGGGLRFTFDCEWKIIPASVYGRRTLPIHLSAASERRDAQAK
jgi:hypothetical protein